MQNTYCDQCGKRAHPGPCAPAVESDCSQATVVIDKSLNNPAYWLAIGSAGTAIDLSVRLRIAGGQDAIAEELSHLAKNFLRLAELAAES